MTHDATEMRTAVRALLAEPLTDSTSPAFGPIRRNRRVLARWFSDELGYRLDATRPTVVRLAKLPGPAHPPRGLSTRSGRPFDGRRYAVTCLVMASAEGGGDFTTLQRLFDDVDTRASGVEGLGWDGQVASDRRVFIQAVQVLQDLGVLVRTDGDEERFARGESGGDALYRVDRDRLSLLPTTAQPPSLAAGPDDIAAEPYPDTEQGRVLRRRHRVTRALVEEPVVYRQDLTEEEVEYLRSQRSRLERILEERVGLSLEVRKEGWVAIDPERELSDLRWPDYGAAETTALRLCDELRSRRIEGRPDAWPMGEVVSFVRALATEYEGYWKRDADDDRGASRLVGEAIAILEAARLAASTGTELRALPAAGRFAAAEAIRPVQVSTPVQLGLADTATGGVASTAEDG